MHCYVSFSVTFTSTKLTDSSSNNIQTENPIENTAHGQSLAANLTYSTVHTNAWIGHFYAS